MSLEVSFEDNRRILLRRFEILHSFLERQIATRDLSRTISTIKMIDQAQSILKIPTVFAGLPRLGSRRPDIGNVRAVIAHYYIRAHVSRIYTREYAATTTAVV